MVIDFRGGVGDISFKMCTLSVGGDLVIDFRGSAGGGGISFRICTSLVVVVGGGDLAISDFRGGGGGSMSLLI